MVYADGACGNRPSATGLRSSSCRERGDADLRINEIEVAWYGDHRAIRGGRRALESSRHRFEYLTVNRVTGHDGGLHPYPPLDHQLCRLADDSGVGGVDEFTVYLAPVGKLASTRSTPLLPS